MFDVDLTGPRCQSLVGVDVQPASLTADAAQTYHVLTPGTGAALVAITGITALLIAYNRKYWLEIATVGAGGMALTFAKNFYSVSK